MTIETEADVATLGRIGNIVSRVVRQMRDAGTAQ